ncbi:hypothetical protein HDZ31DRAFT_44631 [Schizophyllum fasciatum]
MQSLEQISYTTPLCHKCDHSFTCVVGDTDLATFARSIYIPTYGPERDALRQALSNLELSLRGCDAELAWLEERLRLLRAHRAAIEDTADNVKALLGPIRAIPPEILGEIAAHTLPPRWFEERIGKNVWAFAQVCHAWRQVAIGLRWPWASFSLPESMPDTPEGEALIDVVATFLERSGEHPLKIDITYTREHVMHIVWAQLFGERDRIVHFNVSTHGLVYFLPLSSLIKYSLRNPYGPRWTMHSEIISDLYLPKIRTLCLNGVNLPDSIDPEAEVASIWSKLRTLSLSGFDPITPNNSIILGLCCNLVELTLLNNNESTRADLSPIHLPMLRSLIVQNTTLRLCPLIRAPGLVRFKMGRRALVRDTNVDFGIDWIIDNCLGLLEQILKPVHGISSGLCQITGPGWTSLDQTGQAHHSPPTSSCPSFPQVLCLSVQLVDW